VPHISKNESLSDHKINNTQAAFNSNVSITEDRIARFNSNVSITEDRIASVRENCYDIKARDAQKISFDILITHLILQRVSQLTFKQH